MLSLFWCVCSAFSWGHLRFSASCHAAGVPHLADSGWLPFSCGDGLACGWWCLSTDVLFTPWVSTWCLRSFPFRCFPFRVLHPFRVRQHVWLQFAGLLLGLRWRVLCCATWFSPLCRALPQGLQLTLFSLLQVPLGFSGHRVSVLLLPWCLGLGLALPFFLGCFCSTCLLR